MSTRRSNPPLFRRYAGRWRSRASSALVIVLACLVLISVLIVALMGSLSTERKSAQFYANSSSVKLLADSAVSIVMGQIQDATKGTDASGNTLAWASQPGMIRTFDSSGATVGYYKLYSWANMDGTGSFTPTASTETPPANWQQTPALYTDLNDPVSGVYPIVDPSATNLVQGFGITNAPTSTTDLAPMPVQWLYVLQDGTLATATGTGNTATVAAATPGNPIVARVAFWTDDDTCKVNINTAAGDVWTQASSPPTPGAAGNPGSFWDIPRTANLSFEKTYMAKFQPAKDEYQRYPGHPATTYLSAVFPGLTAANIDQIAPRINSGGSVSGTQIAANAITPDSDRLYSSVDELLFTTNLASSVRTQNSPLTETQVEQAEFFLTAHSRAPEVNLYNQPRVVIWPVSSQTNTSSATYRTPYDNLIAYCGTLNHGTNGAATSTPYEYYFQRGPFGANSSGADSPTADLPTVASTPATTSSDLHRNRQLITYLRNLTSMPVPGFGPSSSSFVTKYPLDRDEILTEIFDYIRALNGQDTSIAGLIPYAAPTGSVALGNTSGSGNAGQGQILPITDTSHSDSNTATLRGFGRFATVREGVLVFCGVGQATATGTSTMPSGAPNANVNPIAPGITRVQAFFTLNLFDPNQGYALATPNFEVSVAGLNNFTWTTNSVIPAIGMGFPSTSTMKVNRNYNTGIYGGYKGASSLIGPSSYNLFSTTLDMPTSGTFVFNGGDVTIQIYDATGNTLLQTLTMNFPASANGFPVPGLAPRLTDSSTSPTMTVDYRLLTKYTGSFGSLPSIVGRFTGANVNTAYSTSAKKWICGADTVRSVEANTDPRIIAALTNVPKTFFSEIEPQYQDPTVTQEHSVADAENGTTAYASVGAWFGKFVPNANYGTPSGTGAAAILAPVSDFLYSAPTSVASGGDGLQSNAAPNPNTAAYFAPIAFGMNGGQCVAANGVYAGVNATPALGSTLANPPGDWDTGMSTVNDGAFVNKADEGNMAGLTNASVTVPYYDNLANVQAAGGTFFSPNRQIASAVNFGSLPTGVETNAPWQTLLFHPDPGGTPQHIGAKSPQDYLLLDLFNMPVVEPYAISDPFSTAGKVNMNFQIVPFTYLSRNTALRAVLKPEQIMALSASDAATYKGSNSAFGVRRTFLDLDQTLSGFLARFNSGDIFRSASEVCGLYLVPQGQTYSGMPAFWTSNPLTGDNVRERPYGDIYPRLTTKSNTFTVHYRVQTLKKVSTTVTQWVEDADLVTAEYRGSSTLERYLDSSNPNIPDYALQTQPLAAGSAIDNFYKMRVIETKQFTP